MFGSRWSPVHQSEVWEIADFRFPNQSLYGHCAEVTPRQADPPKRKNNMEKSRV